MWIILRFILVLTVKLILLGINVNIETNRYVKSGYDGQIYFVEYYVTCRDGQIILRLALNNGVGVTTQMFESQFINGCDFEWYNVGHYKYSLRLGRFLSII